jgi:hypothetical protein
MTGSMTTLAAGAPMAGYTAAGHGRRRDTNKMRFGSPGPRTKTVATAIAVCGAGEMGDALQDDTPAGTGGAVEVVHFEGDWATDGTGQLGASIRPEDNPVVVDDVIDRKDFRCHKPQ